MASNCAFLTMKKDAELQVLKLGNVERSGGFT